MARIAIMALEGLEEEVVVAADTTPVDQARVEEIAESPEADIQEMDASTAEVTQIDDAITDTEDTVEALTDVRDAMAETLPEGGMDEASARVVDVAVEHMLTRMGFNSKNSGFAMEGFADKTTRVKATQVAMEGIGDKLKAMGEAIMAAIRKVLETIKNFFAQLFNVAKKNIARAEKIEALAKSVGKREIKKVKGNPVLVLDNKFIQPGALAAALTNNHKTIDSGIMAAMGNGGKLKEVSKKALDALAKHDADGKATFDEYMESADYIFLNWSKLDTEKEGVVTMKSVDNFIGDKYYQVVINKKKFSINSYNFVSTTAAPEGEVDSLEPEQASKVADAVKRIMNDFLQYEKDLKDIKAASFSFMDSIKAGAAAGKAGNPTTEVAYMLQSHAGLIKFINITASKVRGYEMSVANAALNYAAASLSGSAPVGKEGAPQLENNPTK